MFSFSQYPASIVNSLEAVFVFGRKADPSPTWGYEETDVYFGVEVCRVWRWGWEYRFKCVDLEQPGYIYMKICKKHSEKECQQEVDALLSQKHMLPLPFNASAEDVVQLAREKGIELKPEVFQANGATRFIVLSRPEQD